MGQPKLIDILYHYYCISEKRVGQQYFVSLSDMFLDKKTVLKIRLNRGLNLTIVRRSRPCSAGYENTFKYD